MSTDSKADESREPAAKWRQLPDRIDPSQYVESAAEDPVPSLPPPAGDPDTTWMLRYSA